MSILAALFIRKQSEKENQHASILAFPKIFLLVVTIAFVLAQAKRFADL